MTSCGSVADAGNGRAKNEYRYGEVLLEVVAEDSLEWGGCCEMRRSTCLPLTGNMLNQD